MHECNSGNKTSRNKWNQLLDEVVTIIEYKKSITDHEIYINVFSDVTVSYIIVSTDDIFNTTDIETEFPELTRVFEEAFEIKVREGYLPKYLNLRIFSLLFFSLLIILITSWGY